MLTLESIHANYYRLLIVLEIGYYQKHFKICELVPFRQQLFILHVSNAIWSPASYVFKIFTMIKSNTSGTSYDKDISRVLKGGTCEWESE